MTLPRSDVGGAKGEDRDVIRHVGKRKVGKSPDKTGSLAEHVSVMVAAIRTEYHQYVVADTLLETLQQEAKRVGTDGELATYLGQARDYADRAGSDRSPVGTSL